MFSIWQYMFCKYKIFHKGRSHVMKPYLSPRFDPRIHESDIFLFIGESELWIMYAKRQSIFTMGTNLLLGPPEKFYRRNPSGTFRDVHWYHSGDPKKVPGAPSQGFLIFLGFDKNITKIEIWLSYPHFLADFQVSYHFGKLLTARSQGFTASKNQSLDQWDMSISKMKILTP